MTREHIHLIGIGGVGMTALAGLLHRKGCRVTGSDRRLYPPTSEILRSIGLEVEEGFDAGRLRPAPDVVVVGNAVSRGNEEVEEALDRDLRYTSMPALVSERFLRGRHSMVVAGTHGKTTTASMLAWVLAEAGRSPGFLIGGLPLNFELPFDVGGGSPFVIEGDEYDTAFFDKGPKFMHYRPRTAILGTVEFDHADIYDGLEQIKTAFQRLVRLVPRSGLLVRHEDCEHSRDVSRGAPCPVEGFGFESGDWRARGLVERPEALDFEVLHDGRPFCRVALPMSGRHNVRNALSVIAAAHGVGVDPERISAALSRFRGVRRRLELRGEADGIRVFDDFAHHPTAIEASISAVRARFEPARLWAVLEPRSWSMRRNIFQQRIARALALADEVVLAPVFDGETVPEGDRLDVERLARELRAAGRSARQVETVPEIVRVLAEESRPGDLVLVMSNGGFGGIHRRLLEALQLRQAALRAGG